MNNRGRSGEAERPRRAVQAERGESCRRSAHSASPLPPRRCPSGGRSSPGIGRMVDAVIRALSCCCIVDGQTDSHQISCSGEQPAFEEGVFGHPLELPRGGPAPFGRASRWGLDPAEEDGSPLGSLGGQLCAASAPRRLPTRVPLGGSAPGIIYIGGRAGGRAWPARSPERGSFEFLAWRGRSEFGRRW